MLIGVGCGAAVGACLRYGLTTLIKARQTSLFPWATLIINLSGAFLIGVLFKLLTGQSYAILATGLLGGYTTFSTFNVELWSLCRNRKYLLAMLYFFSSVILGIFAVLLGINLVK